MTGLRGVIAAVATAFSAGGASIDEPRLRELVDRLVDGGVQGLVACASTGEVASLSVAERHELTAIMIDQAAGRLPVIVNSGALTTVEAVGLSCDAEVRGAAAVMPIAPYYEPLRPEETFEYYAAIAASIDIPIVAYNHPDATGVNLSPDELGRLGREIPNVEYVKESSGSLVQLARVVTRYGEHIKVFCGTDALVLPALEMGAIGCIVGAANFLARPLADLFHSWEAGESDDARRAWPRMVPALEMILDQDRYSFPAAVKAACRLAGFDLGVPRLPLRDLASDEETALADAVAVAAGIERAVPAVGKG